MSELRPIAASELPAYQRLVGRVFMGAAPRDEDIEAGRPLVELDRTLAVFDQGDLVATAGAYSLRMEVPGGDVAAAGVSRVTVRPTHRRRGLLSAMMARQRDDVRARGEPVAILYASEAAIYGRFGYGIATYSASQTIERRRSAFATGGGADQVRALGTDEAISLLPGLWERAGRGTPGMIGRSEAWWRLVLEDPEHLRRGRGEGQVVVHDGPDGPDGFAAYRVNAEWEEQGPRARLALELLSALTPAAYRALWRHVLDIDLVEAISARNRPVDEPLRHLLADPRALRTSVNDGLWLRLVDVKAALGARAYADTEPVTIGLADDFCPWNRGTYHVGPTGVDRRDGAAELETDAATLAACYLGGNRFTTMAAAGRLRERAPGAAARADRLFAAASTPWCGLHF